MNFRHMPEVVGGFWSALSLLALLTVVGYFWPVRRTGCSGQRTVTVNRARHR